MFSNLRLRVRAKRMINFVDAVVVAVALCIAQFARFGVSADSTVSGSSNLNYWSLTLIIGFAWWVSLGITRSRDHRVVGVGLDEYKRVIVASLTVFGFLAIGSYALQLETARGYVAIAFPVGLILLILSRKMLRMWLVEQRKNGDLIHGVVILGGASAVSYIYESLRSVPESGYRPLAAIRLVNLADNESMSDLPIPVVRLSSNADEIAEELRKRNADALIVASGTNLTTDEIRHIGWALHERGIDMIVAPALTDIATFRLHTQPISGLPMIHVSAPTLTGTSAIAKRGFDILGSSVLILLLSPVLLLLAAAVKLSSPGAVFYAQERVGKGGQPFKMLKFRSMVVNADAQLKELLEAQGTADKPLFKVEKDPRITRIGHALRQYSLDELPQLFNVFMGTMSLVGPRPQREAEVELYDKAAHRRLMVNPGMSGLWQISGRSNLTWEESIRIDLYYVENWSLQGDFSILCRTFGAVLQKDGAV